GVNSTSANDSISRLGCLRRSLRADSHYGTLPTPVAGGTLAGRAIAAAARSIRTSARRPNARLPRRRSLLPPAVRTGGTRVASGPRPAVESVRERGAATDGRQHGGR